MVLGGGGGLIISVHVIPRDEMGATYTASGLPYMCMHSSCAEYILLFYFIYLLIFSVFVCWAKPYSLYSQLIIHLHFVSLNILGKVI